MPRPMRPAPTAATRSARVDGHSPSCSRCCSARAVERRRGRAPRGCAAPCAGRGRGSRRRSASRPWAIGASTPHQTRDRGEEGEAELGVLGDVAVRVQVDVLAPVARLDELACARRRTSSGRWCSGRPADSAARRSRSASRTAMRSLVEPVGDRAHRAAACLRCGCPSARSAAAAPAFITISGGWMIGPGVHQRARERIAAAVHRRDRRWRITAIASLCRARRIDAGRQAHRADA